jgi:hypothetical protein
MRVRHIVLSPVACPAVHCFSTLCHKGNMTCVFWFSLQLLAETFHILRRIQPDDIIVYIGLKFFLTHFRKRWNIKCHENPSSIFCSYQGDKRANPGNLPKKAALSRKFSCTKTSAGYYHKCTLYIELHVTYLLLVSDFNETWIFSTYFRKTMNSQISRKASSGSRVVLRGRTDKHNEADSRFSQFCERA